MTALWSVLFVAAVAVLGKNYGIYSEWFPAGASTEVATTADTGCDEYHGYQIEFLSSDPLMIRIPNFISPAESAFFTGILAQNFTYRLYVNEEDVKNKIAPRLAVLDQHDPYVTCILNRAHHFLGSMASPDFELLSVARYGVSHQVSLHTDASPEPLEDSVTKRQFNRRTSFFVYVHSSDDLEGGETYFPRIPPPSNVDLSTHPGIVAVNNASGQPGLAVKPVSRSAVFWLGMKPDGTVDRSTIHKGLPVTKGEKIGMNIWAKHYLD
ncbi:hypothetical protein BP5796_02907 [Coleophoma crateriformis]|uniref:Fe2OG dioxygenase domain-containing protein n=1 Tax=Coleophoma crateriformis TaxID=565419 RepID=A0A3D8SZK0_9HELO|nr:hypothetical protein BP5796_02907 [Coleophoma crateriformis]